MNKPRIYFAARQLLGLTCNGNVRTATSPSGNLIIDFCECGAWTIEVGGKLCAGTTTKNFKPQAEAFVVDLEMTGFSIEAGELKGLLEELK